jgi:hypothetical protein
MSKIKLISTMDPNESTAYTGKLNSNSQVVVQRNTSGKPLQLVFRDSIAENEVENVAPGTLDPPDTDAKGLIMDDDYYTSIHPRFGSNVASPEYRPPILSLIPLGGNVPVKVPYTSTTKKTIAFVDAPVVNGEKQEYSISSKLWPLYSTGMTTGQSAWFELIVATFEALRNNLTFEVLTEGLVLAGNKMYRTTSPITISLDSNISGVIFIEGDITLSGQIPFGSGYILLVTGRIYTKDGAFENSEGVASVGLIALGGFYEDGTPVDLTSMLSTKNAFYLVRPSPDGSGFVCSFSGTSGKKLDEKTDYTGTSVAKISVLDQAFMTIDGVRKSITPTYFNLFKSAEGSVPTDEDMYAFLRLQFKTQFAIDSISAIIPVVERGNGAEGSFCVQYTIDGTIQESFVVVQQTAKALPNAGVATEPYLTAKISMLHTYRVSEDGYAFWKYGVYVTTNDAGDFVMSTVAPLASGDTFYPSLSALGTSEYKLNDTAGTLISLATGERKYGVSSVYQEVEGQDVPGGSDPYTLVGNEYVSTYTSFRYSPPLAAGHTCDIGAPYDSYVRYRPLGGRVKKVVTDEGAKADYGLVDGTLIVKNTDLLSRRVHLVCTMETSHSGVLHINENVLYHYGRPLDKPFAVFYNSEVLDLLYQTSVNGHKVDHIVTLKAGKEKDIFGDGVFYLYKPSSTENLVGTLVRQDTMEQLMTFSKGDDKDEFDVDLVIIFGDMVQKERVKKFILTDEDFEYFARDYDGLVAHQSKVHYDGTVSSFDGTYRSEVELDALMVGGFLVSKKEQGVVSVERLMDESPAVIVENLRVDGCKMVRYKLGDASARTDLRPGTYKVLRIDPVENYETSIDVGENGVINVLDLPFTIGAYTYVPYLEEDEDEESEEQDDADEHISDTHTKIEERLNTFSTVPYILTNETTLDWNVSPRDDGSYSLFSVADGEKDAKITAVVGAKKYIFTLTKEADGTVA